MVGRSRSKECEGCGAEIIDLIQNNDYLYCCSCWETLIEERDKLKDEVSALETKVQELQEELNAKNNKDRE